MIYGAVLGLGALVLGLLAIAACVRSSQLSRQEERERFAGPALRAPRVTRQLRQLRARQQVLDALRDMDHERDARD